jgi:hypothetical protein
MADAAQYFSQDLSLGATGDLQVADGVLNSQQRILRRLMTNQGDYLWEPTYGAGLPRQIGRKIDLTAITALIRAQMYREASVQQQPEPQINVTPIQNGLYVQISYVETGSNQQQTLSFDVTA